MFRNLNSLLTCIQLSKFCNYSKNLLSKNSKTLTTNFIHKSYTCKVLCYEENQRKFFQTFCINFNKNAAIIVPIAVKILFKENRLNQIYLTSKCFSTIIASQLSSCFKQGAQYYKQFQFNKFVQNKKDGWIWFSALFGLLTPVSCWSNDYERLIMQRELILASMVGNVTRMKVSPHVLCCRFNIIYILYNKQHYF